MLPDTELTRVSATVSRTVALVQRLDEGRVLWPCVSHTIRSENTAECFQTGEGSEMETDRLNSPNTSTVAIEVLGHQLQFSQDPNSKHLGTTVWDSSMVFVKFLEKNSRKGRFCQSKLKLEYDS
ncbi:hypothetical protein Nepgr_013801 [Nepenthes gracilis]|uniref:Uncharacterized protein n=1 Tax=Nepenthes gracilis TaxID=150966 RepID=A0AAD3SI39_NEPGR|nr:hypothetical protein Nepgr_013801 [Nepenthes gracilis]